jgi:hypothetical protein
VSSSAPTPYPEVNAVLRRLLDGVQAILGARLVGMYLDGSLAIGDFDPDKSDIDFVTVTEGTLSDEIFQALRDMHAGLAKGHSKWGQELEGSYIPLDALQHDPWPDALPQIERGGGLGMVRQESGYWAIHRYMLREHGVALDGPAPRSLISAVHGDELRQAVLAVLNEWWAPMLANPIQVQNMFYRCYAVLTMCRMLYTVRHGSIVTKPVAARWAENTLDRRWAPLIRDALAWSRDTPPDLDATLAFIRHTSERCKQRV